MVSFRDSWGLMWSQRFREQFNRAAENAGWPITLRWARPGRGNGHAGGRGKAGGDVAGDIAAFFAGRSATRGAAGHAGLTHGPVLGLFFASISALAGSTCLSNARAGRSGEA